MIAECADKLAHLGEKLFNETEMKYRAGNKVRIKNLDWYNENKGMNGLVGLFTPSMVKLCGMVVTLDTAYNGKYTAIEEDAKGYYLDDSMIEGLVEEEVDLIPKFGEYSDNEPLDIPTMTTEFVKKHGLPCPDGYEFKDENGNVIEAKKIVLEKKKPRYPESVCECCTVLGAKLMRTTEEGYKGELMKQFQLLITCRDAYWYCYAKETNMPFNWKPDWTMYSKLKHCIIYSDNEIKWQGKHFVTEAKVLAFPTAEMRDAFYENFKDLIEVCKELL